MPFDNRIKGTSHFSGERRKVHDFLANRPGSGTIRLAEASRSTVSSTSNKLLPCLSVILETAGGGRVWLTSPAGTSAGRYEPSSLTPKGELQTAEKDIFDRLLRDQLVGSFLNPLEVDELLERTNGGLPVRGDGIDTPFSRIGGPTATATSLAAVLAFAVSAGVTEEVAAHCLYNMVAEQNGFSAAPRMSLPVFMSKIVDGGVHGALDKKDRPLTPVQEFLFVPFGFTRYTDALSATFDVNARFWKLMRERNYDIRIGAEAGIVSAQLTSVYQVLQLMCLAIRGEPGQKPLSGMFIGMDVAASELYGLPEAPDKYYLGRDGKKMFGSEFVDYILLTEYYKQLIKNFPILSIEDPYADADEAQAHWAYGFPELAKRALVITDDATVTQPDRVRMAVKWGRGGLLTKVNQGGTFTRTALAMAIARQNGWRTILSHRSSEAADFVFEAMMAVAAGAEFLKVTVGSPYGGGGGREARVNFVSNANVFWRQVMEGIQEGGEDREAHHRFWGNVPPEERIAGLPYQGALMMVERDPEPWLRKTQALVRVRKMQAAEAERDGTSIANKTAFRFGSKSWVI